MKIAMFGHKQIPSRDGGVEIAVEALSTRMGALGHQVTCYNRGGTAAPEYREPGVRIRPVPTWNRKGLGAVISSFFAALCASFGRFDVVHIHAEGPAAMCWLPKLFGKRVIVTVHGLDWQRQKWKGRLASRYIHLGEKIAVRWADEIIVLSRNTQAYFRQTYQRETHRIPNGVCRPNILPPQMITETLGCQTGEYLLFLGRLVPEKGIHHLIQAFRRVRTGKKLVIAGHASDTAAYRAELEVLAAGDDRICFTGFVQGQMLEELFSNAYLYVLPSTLEGMPISLLEAMSYGSCCLVSHIPECTEVVETQGISFRAGDIPDLTRQLQRLCDDPELVAQYRAAAGFICGKYSWDATVEKTLELYHEHTDRK